MSTNRGIHDYRQELIAQALLGTLHVPYNLRDQFYGKLGSPANNSIFDELNYHFPTGDLHDIGVHLMLKSHRFDGEKNILLSKKHVDEFGNRGINLNWNFYKQPYTTMGIMLPDSNRDTSSNYLIASHCSMSNSFAFLYTGHSKRFLLAAEYRPLSNIDDCLAQVNQSQSEYGYLNRYIRIALNAMIAMSIGNDWSEKNPSKANQAVSNRRRKLRRSLKKGDPRKQLLQDVIPPKIFEFHQSIKAFKDKSLIPSGMQSGGGSSKLPHFRRGHWRNQKTGEGRTQTKRVWIGDVLINAKSFAGDLKKCSTTYSS